MDYIKIDEIILDVNKTNLKDVMGNEELKKYYIDELNEYTYLKADLWNDYLKLFRFSEGLMYIYESEMDVSALLNNENKVMISFELVEMIEYKNDKRLDEFTIINLYLEFNSNSMVIDYSYKNHSHSSYQNKIVILDIVKERNNTTLLVAHDLYNNKVLKLPSSIYGIKNSPEIGKAYICKLLTIINLNNFTIESKLLRVEEELGKVNIYKYLDKYFNCCDYFCSDFNKIIKNSIKDDYYFLLRFSNSIIKKYRGKYQLNMLGNFMDLDISVYKDIPDIEGKLYRGNALIHASRMKSGLMKYRVIKLFNKPIKADDITYTNKKQLNTLTASGFYIENFNSEYYFEQDNSYSECDDFDNEYDLEEDSITSTFIEYREYDNEGEDFMLEYAEHEDLSSDDSGNYISNSDSYYREHLDFENNVDIENYEVVDTKNYQEIPFMGFIDILPERNYIRKKYNGKYFSINDISDPEFITNYEKVDVDKCEFSFNAYVRIHELISKDKNIDIL